MSNITFTDAAVSRAKQLFGDENNNELMLRLAIEGAGCAGFKYVFSFDIEPGEGDTIIENQGTKLLIDPVSVMYLADAEVDFVKSIEGDSFVVRNPQAISHCGCGSSFGVV